MPGLVVMLTVSTVIGLSIAQAVRGGHVDTPLVEALVVLALSFGGYGVDRIFDRRSR